MLKRRSNDARLRWIVFAAAGLLFSVATAFQLGPDPEEEVCSPRPRVVSGLEQLFGEARRARAVSGDDSVIEFFSSRDSGTWTLLRSLPDGRACVVATGRGGWNITEAAPREVSLEI